MRKWVKGKGGILVLIFELLRAAPIFIFLSSSNFRAAGCLCFHLLPSNVSGYLHLDHTRLSRVRNLRFSEGRICLGVINRISTGLFGFGSKQEYRQLQFRLLF